MANATKDPIAAVGTDLESIRADVVSLRDDVRKLAGHLKAGAVNGLSDEASRLYDSLAAQGDRSLDAISRQVEEQPVMSLLLAFAAGFIGGRLIAR
jgi:hypothetical protein